MSEVDVVWLMYLSDWINDRIDFASVASVAECFVGSVCAGICLIAFCSLIRPKTISADPDGWLLVTRNDRTVKVGKGISAFQWLGRKCVKFPSKHERL